VIDGIRPFSGIFVFTSRAPPGVSLGERLTLFGRLDVYQDTDELVAPTLLERSLDAPVEPLVVAARDVGDGGALADAYQSMLVRVENVAVTNENPDAPADYDEFLLDDVLRVDDLFAPDLDNVFPPGTRFRSVTGVLGRSFGHPKLWPRDANDMVPSDAHFDQSARSVRAACLGRRSRVNTPLKFKPPTRWIACPVLKSQRFQTCSPTT
jgi:hypothetical protein